MLGNPPPKDKYKISLSKCHVYMGIIFPPTTLTILPQPHDSIPKILLPHCIQHDLLRIHIPWMSERRSAILPQQVLQLPTAGILIDKPILPFHREDLPLDTVNHTHCNEKV